MASKYRQHPTLADLVEIRGKDECWPAIGAKTNGYRQQLGQLVHRKVWEITNGPILPGLFICHHCDNRGCGNPFHLFMGTPQDNHRDMTKKRRITHGERQHNHKLTDLQVAAIRELVRSGLGFAAAGRRFGVTGEHVSHIIHGRLRRTETIPLT